MSTTLRLAYRTFDGFERALADQIARFRQRHPDVEVEAVPIEISALYETMVRDGGCRSGEWDLFLCSTDWIPALLRAGDLAGLDAGLRSRPPEDWPAGWSDALLGLQTDADGHVFGLPYHGGPELLLYRSDLFEDPEESAAFAARYGRELAPPQTWPEFAEVAEFFSRPDRELYGCVLAALPDGHNNVYDFLIQLWSRGGELFEDGRAAFAGERGVAALQYLHDLIRVRRLTQPDPRAYDSVGSGELYASGRAAMMWNWAGFSVVAERPGSAIRGKNRLGRIPRGAEPEGRHVSLSTYWVMTMPISGRAPELAWEFLRSTASPDGDLTTALSGGIGCRLSTWRDPRVTAEYACYSLFEELHAGVRTMPALPVYPLINEVLSSRIDSVYTGAASVPAALAAAAAEVDEILVDAEA